MGLEKHACNGNELQYKGLERQLNIRVRRGRGAEVSSRWRRRGEGPIQEDGERQSVRPLHLKHRRRLC